MRLLLVEDERSLSRAIVAILKKNAYSVDAVYDGEEALAYLRVGDYDGVILDLMIPRVDGITVLRTIRENGNRVPVLILTARSEVDDIVLGLDSGANDYLTKPFEVKELLARLRAMTRPAIEKPDQTLRYGNVTLNRGNYMLSTPSGYFRLANKEYQMMELLIANTDTVLSTDKLMEKIWGLDSSSEMNVVWVYVSYLRRKLKALNANITIRATRSVGYCLEFLNPNDAIGADSPREVAYPQKKKKIIDGVVILNDGEPLTSVDDLPDMTPAVGQTETETEETEQQ